MGPAFSIIIHLWQLPVLPFFSFIKTNCPPPVFFFFFLRMTLLLGPPSSGKTTLLLALAGKLSHDLKVRTHISWHLKSLRNTLFIYGIEEYVVVVVVVVH